MRVYRKPVGDGRYNFAFAFRGTVNATGWDNNINQVLLNGPGQIQIAETHVDEIIGDPDNRVRNVYFTGHSLGGYLSQWMQARIVDGHYVRGGGETEARTFNAPGFSTVGIPTSHVLTVRYRVNNRLRYNETIRNYQIALGGLYNGAIHTIIDGKICELEYPRGPVISCRE